MSTRDLCLDHCHKLGIVRGVLCRNCNGIEGKIFNLANRAKRQKSVKWFLAKLWHYWETHSEAHAASVYHPDHRTDEEKRITRNRKARLRRAEKKARTNVNKE